MDNGRRYVTRNTKEGGRAASRNCLELMSKIRALDFAIQDTVLYLDAYPCCTKALEYYHSLLSIRERLAKEYESACAPITKEGNTSHSTWDWIASPWPWEPDANGR